MVKSLFRDSFQSGFLSILYSIGSKPLKIWEKEVSNGHIKRYTDSDIQSSVLEILSTNVMSTYITCPEDPKHVLGVKLPFLVMIIKNVRRPPNHPTRPHLRTCTRARAPLAASTTPTPAAHPRPRPPTPTTHAPAGAAHPPPPRR